MYSLSVFSIIHTQGRQREKTSIEVVEHGKSGFLVDTPEDWIHAVRTLCNDPALAKRMGARGKEIVRGKYKLSRWTPSFYSVLTG